MTGFIVDGDGPRKQTWGKHAHTLRRWMGGKAGKPKKETQAREGEETVQSRQAMSASMYSPPAWQRWAMMERNQWGLGFR